MKIKDVTIKKNDQGGDYLLVTMEDDSRYALLNVGTPTLSQMSENILKEIFS